MKYVRICIQLNPVPLLFITLPIVSVALTAMSVKIMVLYDIASCSLVSVLHILNNHNLRNPYFQLHKLQPTLVPRVSRC